MPQYSFDKRGTRRVVNGTRKIEALRRRVAGYESKLLGGGGEFACELIEVHGDYLLCRPIGAVDENGDPDATRDFAVVKPILLRQTPWEADYTDKDGELYSAVYDDGQARTVTRDSDSEEEDQVIVPQYVPRQTIDSTDYAGSIIIVGKPAAGDSFDGLQFDGLHPAYVDQNRDARAWAKYTPPPN